MPPFPAIYDLIVVGGGAAGYFAAITCAEQAATTSDFPLRILILEKTASPLAKVRISGGGRCNLTHACFDPAVLVGYYPRGGRALRSAFTRFNPAHTIAWFEKRGVRLKTEPDGRIFPRSDSSQSIIDCLAEAAGQAGVGVWTQARVVSISHTNEPGSTFQVVIHTAGQRSDPGAPHVQILHGRHVLLATGGEARMLALAGGLGHSIVSPVPSLFTFNVPDKRLEGLAGISVQLAAVRIVNDGRSTAASSKQLQQAAPGPLLITHRGLSGPVVLRLSAWAARWLYECGYHAKLEVNWLAPLHFDQVLAHLLEHKQLVANTRQKAATQDPFQRLPQRLWKRLVQSAGINEQHNWADLSKASLSSLADQLTRGQYELRGKAPFKEEFVTCGGIPLKEVDFKTMESRLTPGLYFAGEILDVDGLTGGFNFQNAWTTGWIAGSSLAARLTAFSAKKPPPPPKPIR